MAELSITHFRDILSSEVKKIEACCSKWDELSSDSSVPEEARGEIRTTIGLAKLLMKQKLKQFSGLIDDSEFKRGEKEITCIDLQGFWDMVFQEVEKVGKCFENLEKCQSNNWEMKEESPIKTKAKKPNVPKVVKPSVQSNPSTKAHILAARKRLAEAKNQMKKLSDSNPEDLVTTDIIKSPKVSAVKRPAKKVTAKADKNKENLKGSLEDLQSPTKKLAVSKKNTGADKVVSTVGKNRKKERSTNAATTLQCVTRSAARALLLKQK